MAAREKRFEEGARGREHRNATGGEGMNGEELCKPNVELAGHDSNAYNLLARCRKAARSAGWTEEQIQSFLDRARAGDHGQLMAVIFDEFNVT